MIKGHGDDAYQYAGIAIKSDFSSNICLPAHGHQALMAHLAACPHLLSHYPEPEAWSLERMLAERYGISPDCVIVTCGATEAIYLVAQTFRLQHTIPSPTFSEYDDACNIFPTEDFEHDAFWVCNPNNPTGSTFNFQHSSQSEVAKPSATFNDYDLVVIDQSYEHYTDKKVMTPKAAVRHGNVVQLHSMTKTYAVPGLRLGYIVTSVRLAQMIRRYMRPWAVSALAVEAGKFLLQHDELMVHPDLAEAQRLRNLLDAIDGITVLPTQTNFMLCLLEGHTAAQLKDYLARQHGMLIRDASNFTGLDKGHFRVASQSPAENNALVAAIQSFLYDH